jgi:hypothetical protein
MPPDWAASIYGDGARVRIAWSGAGPIVCDGDPVAHVSRGSEALPLLQRTLTSAAVAALAPRFVLLHAGAVAWRNQGALLPAASGSGKSTLVAGLVAAGCEYLSDEIVILDPVSRRLMPFGNCLSLKAGGRRAFVDAYPGFAHAPRERIDAQSLWRVPISSVHQPAGPVPVRFIVLPTFVPAAPAVLRPIVRAQTLDALLAQTYRLQLHGPAGLTALVNTIQASRCFSLVGGDLRARVELLLQLLQDSDAAG